MLWKQSTVLRIANTVNGDMQALGFAEFLDKVDQTNAANCFQLFASDYTNGQLELLLRTFR